MLKFFNIFLFFLLETIIYAVYLSICNKFSRNTRYSVKLTAIKNFATICGVWNYKIDRSEEV